MAESNNQNIYNLILVGLAGYGLFTLVSKNSSCMPSYVVYRNKLGEFLGEEELGDELELGDVAVTPEEFLGEDEELGTYRHGPDAYKFSGPKANKIQPRSLPKSAVAKKLGGAYLGAKSAKFPMYKSARPDAYPQSFMDSIPDGQRGRAPQPQTKKVFNMKIDSVPTIPKTSGKTTTVPKVVTTVPKVVTTVPKLAPKASKLGGMYIGDSEPEIIGPNVPLNDFTRRIEVDTLPTNPVSVR
jgi:hypothetical protein